MVFLMSRVLTVLGARPQFVKAAVVSRALAAAGVNERIIHTGQHSDAAMSEIFFAELGIPAPSVNLGISGGGQGAQAGAMMIALERELVATRRSGDLVLVYGDTNSTLAGALVGSKLGIPVVHVEAGLRSWNRSMPEEANRVIADHLSMLLLCPTEQSVSNLAAEGIVEGGPLPRRVALVGDVMLDAAIAFGPAAGRVGPLATPAGSAVPHLLVTVHRAENTDDPRRLGIIVEAVRLLAREMPVVWPVHPRVRRLLPALGLSIGERDGGLWLVEPVGYLEMLALERQACCVLTDSGGVQKEAFFAGVPCVTVRDETEWLELVEAGWNRIVPPTDSQAIVEAVKAARPGRPEFAPYGAGDASVHIAELISAFAAR
jgi:UDP-GlcNAc3NAcA epimerase